MGKRGKKSTYHKQTNNLNSILYVLAIYESLPKRLLLLWYICHGKLAVQILQ